MPDGFQQPALWALLGSAFDEEPIIFQTLLLHRLFWKSIQILLWTSLKMSLLPDLKEQIWIICECKNSRRWNFYIYRIKPAPTFPQSVGSTSVAIHAAVASCFLWIQSRCAITSLCPFRCPGMQPLRQSCKKWQVLWHCKQGNLHLWSSPGPY